MVWTLMRSPPMGWTLIFVIHKWIGRRRLKKTKSRLKSILRGFFVFCRGGRERDILPRDVGHIGERCVYIFCLKVDDLQRLLRTVGISIYCLPPGARTINRLYVCSHLHLKPICLRQVASLSPIYHIYRSTILLDLATRSWLPQRYMLCLASKSGLVQVVFLKEGYVGHGISSIKLAKMVKLGLTRLWLSMSESFLSNSLLRPATWLRSLWFNHLPVAYILRTLNKVFVLGHPFLLHNYQLQTPWSCSSIPLGWRD